VGVLGHGKRLLYSSAALASPPRRPDDAAIHNRGETAMSRIMIVVEFEVKPEHASEFVTLMKGHARLSRAEDGCQQFDVMQAQDNPNHVLFVEAWRDQAALDVHSRVPRMAENRKTYEPWLVSRKATRCIAD
jgi:(4S)-4-hydroxy-5-phosphonooxypentane-2,3-dione isomerase